MSSLSYQMLLVSFLLGFSSCIAEKKDPPNIIFILVDDLGWTDLGSYGSSFYETPNIDRLAAQAMRFTNAYAASPVCSPTRAAIMTGQYPSRVNITDWIPGQTPKGTKMTGPEDLHQLPLEEITLAEALKEKGYSTFYAGKWHLGDEGYFPEDQGFDENKGGHHVGSPPGGYYSPYKNPKLSDGPEGEYLTDRLTNESIQFIEQHQNEPFFLYLSFYTVHTPIQACKRHLEKFETKLGGDTTQFVVEHEGRTAINQANPAYASMVYALDENIGKLLQKLEEADLENNTIIIFTSDNGGLSTLNKRRTAPTAVKPLRAGKGWCYEGGIRVPLIIKAPGIEAGTISHTPVISNDFYPTILELAGFPLMADQHVDGLSLLPVLHQKGNINREALFWHFPHYHGSTWTPGSAIRMGDWKLIDFYHYEKTELYNLKDDLGETKDLAEQYPDKVKELKNELSTMLEATGAKFPGLNPEYVEKDSR